VILAALSSRDGHETTHLPETEEGNVKIITSQYVITLRYKMQHAV
jgi:hypothetical protein